MSGLRILIADDHELVRRGLRNLLEAQPEWHVIAEAVDGREAIEAATELKPDVVVLDLAMPRLNGLEAARRITKVLPQARVLVLTMHDSDELIRAVLECGARGYVTKSDTSRDLVNAVDALRKNRTFFTPRVDQMLLDSFRKIEPVKNGQQLEAATPMDRLTSRQREIVQLVAEGKSSKEVAVVLGVSVKTVETHRANLMKRLHCTPLASWCATQSATILSSRKLVILEPVAFGFYRVINFRRRQTARLIYMRTPSLRWAGKCSCRCRGITV